MTEELTLYALAVIVTILGFMLFYFMERCQELARQNKCLRNIVLMKVDKDPSDDAIDKLALALGYKIDPEDDVVVEELLKD